MVNTRAEEKRSLSSWNVNLGVQRKVSLLQMRAVSRVPTEL